ncbi:DUF2490 domain-containing protein [uncultured Sphingomonas sp.]|uniref:DUF2490 domain-containing protein n=1 Tax=uncultured Sphingomonas sp. TaxID=158754 RepID=UPI002600556F|nr:DUF2490 domain-containing protein [uncultured Sphingomonas sp.]
MRIWHVARIAALAFAMFAGAFPSIGARQDEQIWLQANTHVPIAPRVRLTLEQIMRFGDRANGLFQTEVGGILGYRLNRHIEIGAGYRNVGVESGTRTFYEDRVRQHVLITLGRWSGRFRVDERFHPDGNEIGFRIRPLVRYNLPLNKQGLAFFASHESFYLPNGTRWGQRRGYDRMRNLVGFVLPLSLRTSADVGYLNQYRPARSTTRAQIDHALSIQLTVNLAIHPPPSSDD